MKTINATVNHRFAGKEYSQLHDLLFYKNVEMSEQRYKAEIDIFQIVDAYACYVK